MALLDVSDILDDPDLSDVVSCVRNFQTVGADGIAVNTQVAHKFRGVVTSDNGDVLTRLPNGERIRGSMTIHTVFRLSDGSNGQSADVVLWQGRHYTVTTVNDFSNYGRGFVAAGCELIELTG